VAGANDGGRVHACVGPTLSSHVNYDSPSSHQLSCISLFKKLL
jgi:hypothetical protein